MAGEHRRSLLKAFDDTKAGVKGLVDSGITKIPQLFVHDHIKLNEYSISDSSQFDIPVLDFGGIGTLKRAEIIDKLKVASEKWGFFQIINHEIPPQVMDRMIDGVRRFNEQDVELKRPYYTRDPRKRFNYLSNFDLYQSQAATWRDSMTCRIVPDPPQPEDLPPMCRDMIYEYTNYIMRLGTTLFELLSKVLGLDLSHLRNLGCSDGLFLIGQYYPPCPEPELTMGIPSHSDTGFLTPLIQDQVGGLQILHQSQWIDVHPVQGAIIVNFGDLLLLITNDKFKRVKHRALAQKTGPRISMASFFRVN